MVASRVLVLLHLVDDLFVTSDRPIGGGWVDIPFLGKQTAFVDKC